MGSVAYDQAVALTSGPDSERFKQLREAILTSYIGPDCYWKSPDEQAAAGCTRFFGNAWFIPFPPTVVRRARSYRLCHLLSEHVMHHLGSEV